jgi:hypothetical protein
MKQGKLLTSTFTISCPHCRQRQINGNGAHAFRATEVKAGQARRCTNRACGQEFKLPAKLQANIKVSA